jgi:LysR family transcriptional activator of glutamate synthase operon
MLPAPLAAFRALHPQVNFALHEGPRLQLEERVLRGELELAITSPLPSTDRGLTAVPLLRDELVAALPPGHRLAQAEEVRLQLLSGDPFIFLAGTFGELHTVTTDACARAGFRPRVAFEAEGLATMRGLVGAGLGVALLPALASRVRDEAAPTPVFRRLAGEPAFRVIGLVRHAGRMLSPAAAAFAELLMSRARLGAGAD